MEELKQRILKEGKVIIPEILKVDNFLNHQLDPALFQKIGAEFKKRFQDEKIDKILTIEASGIALALATAYNMDHIPVVFAKKGIHSNIGKDLYISKIHSYTKQEDYLAFVSKSYLHKGEKVLIIDDFLANGQAVLGLLDILKQAGCSCVGVGIAIEKGFQKGRSYIESKNCKVESLVIIDRFEGDKVILR